MENENLKPVEKLTPFTKMIMTIGTLPSSFYASMSYYESMVWLYEYIKNEVIPAVNNNGEAVEELQEKFIELKTWIDEYFDNLDVQEEINKKLDEMAEDGSFDTIFSTYITNNPTLIPNEINSYLNDYDINSVIDNKIDDMVDNNEFQPIVKPYVDDYAQNYLGEVIEPAIEQQNAFIQTLESGSPLVASSTSGMTDTSRVYVNTTDGNWYYYDGDSWEIGGVYQSSAGYQDFKNNLNEISNTGLTYLNLYSTLKKGRITNGAFDDTGNWRVATYDSITLNRPIKLTAESGYKFGVVTYSGGSAVDSGWQTSYTIPKNTEFRVQIAKTTEDYSEADVDLFTLQVKCTSFESNIKNILQSSVEVFISQNAFITFNVDNSNEVVISANTNRLYFMGLPVTADVYHDYDSNISITLPNNYYAIINLNDFSINVVEYDDIDSITYPFTIIARNHYGTILGQWFRYWGSNAINLSAYGSRLIEPSTNNKIGLVNNNGTIEVTLPSRLLMMNIKDSTDAITPIDVSAESNTFNVPNYYYFVYNLKTKKFQTMYLTTLISNLNNVVILFYSNNGYPVGQWRRYSYYNELTDKITELHGKTTNSVYTFISREGDIDNVPLNSIYGVIKSKKYGYDRMRVDVRLTSDNVFVLSHDATINSEARNVDGTEIEGSISIADHTLSELNQYDFGIKKGSQYAGLEICTLDDFLKYCSYAGLIPVLEIKITLNDSQVSALCNLITKYGLGTKAWISDDHTSNISKINTELPFINIGYIAHISTNAIDTAKAYVNFKHKVQLDAYRDDTFTQALIKYANANGVDIKVGSAYNTADLLNYANAGVIVIECSYVKYPNEILNNNISV